MIPTLMPKYSFVLLKYQVVSTSVSRGLRFGRARMSTLWACWASRRPVDAQKVCKGHVMGTAHLGSVVPRTPPTWALPARVESGALMGRLAAQSASGGSWASEPRGSLSGARCPSHLAC